MDDLFGPLGKVCVVEGCNNPFRANGYCRSHAMRQWRYGDPLAGSGYRTGEPYKYLLSIVTHIGSSCVKWPFSNNGTGYGDFRRGGKHYLAHREICRLAHGEPPSEYHEAAHECGQGHNGCVNPEHLSWKLPKCNQADKKIHGTQLQGEEVHFAVLNESQAFRIRHGGEGAAKLSREFGISRSTVYDIRTRKSWKHLP